MTKKPGKCSRCDNIADRKCFKCGEALCWKCGTDKYCSTCKAVIDDKAVIDEYFREKYANKLEALVRITPVLLLLFAFSVIAQSATSDYTKTCVLVNDDYIVKEPVYNTTTITWPNSTKETKQTIIGYTDVLVRRNKEVCNESVSIGGKNIDFKLQGYNCKNTTGEVICDSCIDGNCDGTCSPNGGETCAKITSGIVQYKNSVIAWNESTKPLAVGVLK